MFFVHTYGYNPTSPSYNMTRWKKDATEFVVSLLHNRPGGTSISTIPKPLLEMLGNPNKLKFVIKNGKIIMMRP